MDLLNQMWDEEEREEVDETKEKSDCVDGFVEADVKIKDIDVSVIEAEHEQIVDNVGKTHCVDATMDEENDKEYEIFEDVDDIAIAAIKAEMMKNSIMKEDEENLSNDDWLKIIQGM